MFLCRSFHIFFLKKKYQNTQFFLSFLLLLVFLYSTYKISYYFLFDIIIDLVVQMNKLDLSIQDTYVLKGLALILLLVHHLFCEMDGPFNDIVFNGIHVLQAFSSGFSKFCVALFVFLSGYGLTKSTNLENKRIKKQLLPFYWRRIVKLMLNYWLIWILFVPIGIIFFNRSFPEVYGPYYLIKTIIDFFGLAYAFGYFGYNATWWFYSCILVLYFIFPYIFLLRRSKLTFLLVVLFFSILGPHTYVLKACTPYHYSFVLGILMATYNLVLKKNSIIICLITIIIVGLFRIIRLGGVIWQDPILCYFITVVYASTNIHKWLKISLSFLGKHSFNIFLFHTFIYLYYFPNFIYWTPNPLLIFFTMLLTCLFVSILIEYLKVYIGFFKLQKYLLGLMS